MGIQFFNVARQQTGPVCATGSKNDPKPGKKREQAYAPCFQSVISLFSLCYLLLEKSSKSLIPLGDCPFAPQSPPCFSWKSPCFREKTGPALAKMADRVLTPFIAYNSCLIGQNL
jgi:hypothetical protein